MVKYFLILSLIFAFFNAFCDGVDEQKNHEFVTLPDPSSFEFSKYGTYPVGYSTGIPTIEIPIYTIDAGGYQVPILLKYHASGCIPGQESSWVGMGWTLDYGGEVNRTINGTPDDGQWAGYQQYLNKCEGTDLKLEDGVIQMILNKIEGYNFEPDFFNYSCNTYSGNFLYGFNSETQKMESYIYPFIPIKTDFLSSAINPTYKTIVTPDGTQFLFRDSDKIRIPKGSPETYETTWHLNKIILPNKKAEITYTYQPDGSYCSYAATYTQSTTYTYDECAIVFKEKEGLIESSADRSVVTSVKPMKITFPNGEIHFILGDREDITNLNSSLKKLDRIEIYKRNSSDQLAINQVIQMHTSYFIGGNNSKRLRLDSIDFDSHSYKFEYSQEPLPDKQTTKTDPWGFYCKTKTNSIFEPSVPDLISTKAGVLKSIIYPTGGKTEFSYELNSYFGESIYTHFEDFYANLDGIGDANISINDLPPSVDEPYAQVSIPFSLKKKQAAKFLVSIAQDGYDGGYANKYAKAFVQLYKDGEIIPVQDYFTPDFPTNERTLYLEPGDYQLYLYAYGDCMHINVKYTIDKTSTTEKQNVVAGGLRIKEVKNYDSALKLISHKAYKYGLLDSENSSGYLTSNVTQPYYLKSRTIATCKSCDQFIGNGHEIKNIVTKVSHPVAGFGRNSVAYSAVCEFDIINGIEASLKEIVLRKGFIFNDMGRDIYDFSWLGGQPLKTTYFNYSNGTYEPIKEEQYAYSEINTGSIVEGFTLGSGVDPSSNLCPDLPYIKVVAEKDIITVSVEENLETINKVPMFVIAQALIEYAIDKAKGELFYFYTYEALMGCAYTFQENEDGEITITIFYGWNTIPTGEFQKNPLEVFSFGKLVYGLNFLKTDSITTINYFDNGKKVTEKVIQRYNNLSHAQISIREEINSKNENIVTRYFYPGDIDSDVAQALVKRNRVNQLIKNEKFLDNKIVLGSLTNFGYLSGTKIITSGEIPENASIVPSEIQNTNSEGLYLQSFQMDAYDTYVNLLQYHKSNDIAVSYLWGYNGQYPIAKAENAQYESVGTILGLKNVVNTSPKLFNGKTYSENELDAYLEAISNFLLPNGTLDKAKVTSWQNFTAAVRTALPDAVISFYTYEPLVGMTSQTDANGNTVYYEYDGFGRLKCVRDMDGNILKVHEYNYAQPTN